MSSISVEIIIMTCRFLKTVISEYLFLTSPCVFHWSFLDGRGPVKFVLGLALAGAACPSSGTPGVEGQSRDD